MFCVGFARNLILFLFEREHEGYKRFADCTVSSVPVQPGNPEDRFSQNEAHLSRALKNPVICRNKFVYANNKCADQLRERAR